MVYEPEAAALFERMTTQPDAARKGLIDTLFKALKTGGVLAKLDVLCVLAAHDQQAARRNWIEDRYNLTPVSAPAFVADRGYQGDSSAAYLETSFVPATSGGKFLPDSASVGFWSRTNILSDNYDMGAFDAAGTNRTDLRCRRADTSFAAYLNDATFRQGQVADPVGLYSVSRLDANTRTRRVNKTYNVNDAAVRTNRTSQSIRVLGVNGQASFSARQCAAMWIGAGLTQSEHHAAYDALSSYLTAVGAA